MSGHDDHKAVFPFRLLTPTPAFTVKLAIKKLLSLAPQARAALLCECKRRGRRERGGEGAGVLEREIKREKKIKHKMLVRRIKRQT